MALELQNISKVVGGKAYIKNTTLTFETGHFNVLLGETGVGKTSLIKLIAGLEPLASGNLILNGVDITKLNTQKRNISLVHQFFINYPHMTVFDNIASPLRVAGIPKSEIQDRVIEAAKTLKLETMLERMPHELSGGQQQRTALARAIAKESKVVLLDEPLANLDYKLREELRELLPELFSNRKTVVIYATSEPVEALLLGGQTVLMDDGNVRQNGTTTEIYRNPTTLLAAKIFSNPPINYAKVQKKASSFFLNNIFWEVPKKLQGFNDGEYQFAIRPYHVMPMKKENTPVSISGRISVAELSGSESIAHFDFEGNSWISMAHGVHLYSVGEDHIFYLNPEDCFYFDLNGNRIN